MSNTVIDKKQENHTFGFWPAKEKVETTLTLVDLKTGRFGLTYESEFSGIKGGHVSGGPEEVSGDINKCINDSPKVMLNISNYNKTAAAITMSVNITVDIPVIGTETIYNQTLSGTYTSAAAWETITNNLKTEFDKQKQVAVL